MWTAEEWAIRNAPIARHTPWNQQAEQNNPWDYNIKIVPDQEERTFLSASVTTRSQSNIAPAQASGLPLGEIPSAPPTTPMRYVPGVGFVHQPQNNNTEEDEPIAYA
jgi:hypothetical protein